VTVRGENYVPLLTLLPIERRPHHRAQRSGMTIFSPDGNYGYVCSSFTPQTW